MMRWLPVLPWRQRNIRECRIVGPNPNLFKGPVPEITTIDMPAWAVEERKKNPKAEFGSSTLRKRRRKLAALLMLFYPAN